MELHWLITVYAIFLSYILTPGIVVTLPKGASKHRVAAVHSIIFGIVWLLTYKFVLGLSKKIV
jgi:hypothetical protein